MAALKFLYYESTFGFPNYSFHFACLDSFPSIISIVFSYTLVVIYHYLLLFMTLGLNDVLIG